MIIILSCSHIEFLFIWYSILLYYIVTDTPMMMSIFDVFPLMLLVPIMAKYQSLCPNQMFVDFMMPTMAVAQLLLQSHERGTLDVATWLGVHYVLELIERGDLRQSIKVHHVLSILMILGSLFAWSFMRLIDSPNIPFHIQCIRYLLFAEVSTIFLNLRTLFEQLKVPPHIQDWNSAMFYVTFLVTRFGPAPIILRYYPGGLLYLAYIVFLCMNIYWCVKMGRKIICKFCETYYPY